MKRPSGKVAIVVIVVLLMSAFVNVFLILPQSQAGIIHSDKDGNTEWTAEFPGSKVAELKLPADANVTKTTINISTMDFGGDYPEDIQLIFGDSLPYDWAYRGEGHGAYGYQEYFSKGQLQVNLSYDPDKTNDTVFFYLPKNAEVDSASVKLSGFEYDYWYPWIKEINIPDRQTWQQDPMPYVFQNRLWVFFRDYNSTETDQSDGDIAYTSTTDGVNWIPVQELTPNGDTIVNYPDGGPDHLAGDFHPYVIDFKGDMGVFWGSMSFYNLPTGGPWGGITNGTDRDIVARWYDSASSQWGDYIEITHPTLNANESNYTKNPDTDNGNNDIRPWHKTDQRPNVVEFKNKVYCIWMTNNTGNTSFNNYEWNVSWWHWNHKGDIIISSSSDGETWSNGVDLTAGDRWWDIDFAPTLCVYDGKLYAMWETNAPRYWNDSGVWKKKIDVVNKYDWDIVYRYTEDGVTWSDFIEMTPKNDTPQGELRTEFSYPDEDPRLVVYDNKMWCIWRTRNPDITNGTDYDIVLWYTTDGINWTESKEMTDPVKNGNFDNKPELTVFDNKLYVVWRREQGERWEDNPDGDIVSRHWDGKEWSVLQEVSPPDGEGTGRDDFYPNSAVFGDKMYTFWVTRNRGTGWTEGTDADVVYRIMEPSDLPIDSGLDIGDDDNWELNVGTPLTDANPSKVVDFKTSINKLLENPGYVAENTFLDSYGNEMVQFMAKVYIGQPGRVRLDDLDIKYTCTLEVGDGITVSERGDNPFRKKINDYIASNPQKVDAEGNIIVTLQLTSAVKGKVKLHDLFLEYNLKPSLTILNPIAPAESLIIERSLTGEYDLTWTDTDLDDDAQISFYYYNIYAKKSNAKLITSGISEDDTDDLYTWIFTKDQVPNGQYYIFGRINDGIDIIEDSAPGLLNVTWMKQHSPEIRFVNPVKLDLGWDYYRIRWVDFDPDDNAKIYLYYMPGFKDYINATQIDIDEDGTADMSDFIYEDLGGTTGEYYWNITSMSPGAIYYIAAMIDDEYNPAVWNSSQGRVKKAYIQPPDNLTLEDDTNPLFDVWETHSLNPKLNWRLEYTGTISYHFRVWEGTSSAGKLLEDKVIQDTKGVVNTKLSYGKTYYVEVYAISESGARSEPISLVFSVVNTAPAAPSITLLPEEPSTINSLSVWVTTTSLDEDNDPLTFSYTWYKDGVHLSDYDDKRNILSDDTEKGQVWKVEVTGHDGIISGPMSTATTTIGNAIPTCSILEPKKDFELNENTKVQLRGAAEDADGDSIVFVGWYIDMDNPANISANMIASSSPIKVGEGEGATSALEFKYSNFKKGTHNLTLVVYDGESLLTGKPSSQTIKIEVGSEPKKDTVTDLNLMIGAVVAMIIIIVVILLLFMMLRKRKPVSEREQMYGKDMGLKPGEAYPVEDKDSYFGDDLDRKGVSSLESPASTEKLSSGATSPAVEGKPKQPQLPPTGGA